MAQYYSEIRNNNFLLYKSHLINNQLSLTSRDTDFISSFAIPILNKNRNKIVKELTDNKIEVRPLIAGNMANKPMWYLKYGKVELKNCQLLDDYGFYVPNHQDLTSVEIEKITDIINKHS